MTQTIVLTGGTNGIGAATVDRLISDGNRIINLDIAPSDRNEIASVHCDLSQSTSIADAVSEVPTEIDGIVHIAGVAPGQVDDVDIVAINFLGMRALNESLLPRIRDNGRVVIVASSIGRDWPENIGPVTAMLDTADMTEGRDWLETHRSAWDENPYKFSKQCAAAYTYRAAGMTQGRRINTNCVNPGIVETRLSPRFRELVGNERYDRINDYVGRSGEPGDIAGVIRFLLGPDAAWVNGVELQTDGGYRAGVVGGWLT